MERSNPAQGWFHHRDSVLALLEELRPKTVVELGTWKGQSAIAMAWKLAEWGGVIHCVDTWTGDVNGIWGTQPGPPNMLLECATNIVATGCGSHVRLIPATTLQAAATWNGPAVDFVWVDADHSYEATKADCFAWFKHVRPGGFIAGDDYDNPMYPGVKKAWDEFFALEIFDEYAVETPKYPTYPPSMKFPWARK